mmetsp:Transcript_15689/g.18106  ORF Transcript_15689/g.18106 Transcript_15689/m.18106 type:complete len:129 (+) Transcript_15689:371-757(+)
MIDSRLLLFRRGVLLADNDTLSVVVVDFVLERDDFFVEVFPEPPTHRHSKKNLHPIPKDHYFRLLILRIVWCPSIILNAIDFNFTFLGFIGIIINSSIFNKHILSHNISTDRYASQYAYRIGILNNDF